MVAVTVPESTRMSALSVRSPGAARGLASLLDSRSLRLRGVTALDSVRRNLFGCADREENRRFVERELSRRLELDSERWGFDFARDEPLPGTQRYAWRLESAGALPEPFRRAPAGPAPPAVSYPVAVVAALPAPTAAPAPSPPTSTGKTQKRITDFLKPRKRLATSAKKSSPAHAHKHDCSGHGAHIRPPKVARLAQPHYKRS